MGSESLGDHRVWMLITEAIGRLGPDARPNDVIRLVRDEGLPRDDWGTASRVLGKVLRGGWPARTGFSADEAEAFFEPVRRRTAVAIPSEADHPAGCRIHGLPWLPDDAGWPCERGRPLRFLCQVALADVPDGVPARAYGPDRIVSVFVDDLREIDLDSGTEHLMSFSTKVPGRVRERPLGLSARQVPPARPFAFETADDWPQPDDPSFRLPEDFEPETWHLTELRERFDSRRTVPDTKVGGWACGLQDAPFGPSADPDVLADDLFLFQLSDLGRISYVLDDRATNGMIYVADAGYRRRTEGGWGERTSQGLVAVRQVL